MLEYCVDNKNIHQNLIINDEKYIYHEYVCTVVCLWYLAIVRSTLALNILFIIGQ